MAVFGSRRRAMAGPLLMALALAAVTGVALGAGGEVAEIEGTFTIEGRLQPPRQPPVGRGGGAVGVAGIGPTRVVVNGGEFSTHTRRDGSFALQGVPPGKYLVEVHSHAHVFSTARVQVGQEGQVQALEYKYPGAPRIKAAYPLVLTAHGQPNWFEKRESVDFLAFFKNPMMLMMLFSVGMIVCLPKMMKNMDPEAMKEYEEMQAKMGGGDGDIFSMLKGAVTGEEPEKEEEGAEAPGHVGKRQGRRDKFARRT